jgi:hypothetical protein
VVQIGRPSKQENIVQTTIKYVAPWLATVVIGAAIGLAPVASAHTISTPIPQTGSGQDPYYGSGADPLVPNTPGADPYSPYTPGLHTQNQDETDTSGGQLDLPS